MTDRHWSDPVFISALKEFRGSFKAFQMVMIPLLSMYKKIFGNKGEFGNTPLLHTAETFQKENTFHLSLDYQPFPNLPWMLFGCPLRFSQNYKKNSWYPPFIRDSSATLFIPRLSASLLLFDYPQLYHLLPLQFYGGKLTDNGIVPIGILILHREGRILFKIVMAF